MCVNYTEITGIKKIESNMSDKIIELQHINVT